MVCVPVISLGHHSSHRTASLVLQIIFVRIRFDTHISFTRATQPVHSGPNRQKLLGKATAEPHWTIGFVPRTRRVMCTRGTHSISALFTHIGSLETVTW